ncbi:PREDICTED: uncharacterized protein LOC108556850 [Nicrophorus vespilloides]|uniref:Uncharacterized protein LOC108556850 n=1 Tax=Nicrophorus vespilloides TaxID=110193 RepID=A0ABM1M222_NICVS|nr:PREDICTED: uncharacterized protein LOC108556850 [Nicrophorus vespilloides]
MLKTLNVMFLALSTVWGCKKSEFSCDFGSRCIGVDKFCNGVQDCGDSTDEPPNCVRNLLEMAVSYEFQRSSKQRVIAACNRTYHGEVGHTYDLEIRRPAEDDDGLPFLCHLNFTALGKNHGELVQLSFDAFSVGTFESFTSQGCPDGFISITESNRPSLGGKWCGSSWGYTVYYSETPSINLTLFIERLPPQQASGYNTFEFKLSYKFLRLSDARIRYGNVSQRLYRGKLHAGTYCDRLLEGCNKRSCRIQSPNYPGIYPRNVSCNYRIRDRSAPPGKHALIAVRQANTNVFKGLVTKFDNSDRVFRIWDRCNVIQDYIEITDGWEQSAPILVHLCSGESMPEIVSSGPELLLKFRTSPYGNPFHPLPLSHLPGFELEVQIFYVNKESPTYIEQGKKCEFLVSAFENPSGILESPVHSLPPNTTCHYYFRGHRHEVVWISFIKYHVAGEKYNEADCDVQLQLWDGDIKTKNVPLMGQFCKDERPKLCDHLLLNNSTRVTRSCNLKESYVSTKSDLTIAHTIRYGNVLYPSSFVIRYEFVDLSQEGVQASSMNPCERIMRAPSGRFHSPRTTFLFGRGGNAKLNCAYHFEAGDGKRVELHFTGIHLGKKRCYSYRDPESGRWKCKSFGDQGLAQIHISEYPWKGVEIKRDCLCGNLSEASISTRTGRKVVVGFVVTGMNVSEDFRDYHFEGSYEFLGAGENRCLNPWKGRRLKGSSGEITVHIGNGENGTLGYCTNQPWLIEPEDPVSNFLYLKIRGFEMRNSTMCGSKNRILVHSPSEEEVKVICPDAEDSFETLSKGWSYYSFENIRFRHSRSFVVEFLQREPFGSFAVNWMEISKNPALTLPSGMLTIKPPACQHTCPEIGACISSDLWCDGLAHCPSAYDEEGINCANQSSINTILTTVAFVASTVLIVALTFGISLCFWQHRRREQKSVIVSVTEHTFLEFKSGYC